MSDGKEFSEKEGVPPEEKAPQVLNEKAADEIAPDEIAPEAAAGVTNPSNMRIQFTEAARPERPERLDEKDAVPADAGRRPSLPPVITQKEKDRRKRAEEQDKKNVNIDEHLLPPQDVATRYNTSINLEKPGASLGLTTAEAERLLAQNGLNILTPPKRRHPFLKYLDKLKNLFNILLIVAGILEYILLGIDYKANFQNTYLGAILIIVAFLNALIEWVQEAKSQKLLESFLNMIPAKAMCIRDGKLAQIEASHLVLGDVVLLQSGAKTPADILVFSANDCKVDNSSLTGESEPQERTKDNDMQNPLEATNLMFNSTLVVSGEAYGIVVRCGDSTVLGQIANLTAGEDKTKSPLAHEIGNFVKIIAFIAIVTAAVFFGISFAVNPSVSVALTFAIGIFVAWVPEGLPATVTMLLSIAAKRMAEKNVLVKDLQGVETLGAITMLCTDKTGTLTKNSMTVTNIWACGELYDASASAGAEKELAGLEKPGVEDILLISALCSKAKFNRTDVPVKEREIMGDATESGLIRYATQLLPEYDGLADKYPKAFEIPFNSENKYMITISKRAHKDGSLTLYMKGAPERVLLVCNRILTGPNGENEELSEKHKATFQDTYELMASHGHRVLAFAELFLPASQYPEDYHFDKKLKNWPQDGLIFVGLASLEDPPKHGVREAIGTCRSAGIRVVMVTGDHALTAASIGRKINLMLGETREMMAKRLKKPIEEIDDDECSAIVVKGEEIDGLSDADWDHIFAKEEIIFARTSPKNKLEIVRRAQSQGHVVGMTGDGVNDAPSVKAANLGISMNISGSDVSKEAAAMILLDDNFASIVNGIIEGRLIFLNLKKSIQYTISHSTPEVIPNLLYVIVPIPLPIGAILILVIDLGFELIAALSYAWDPAEAAESMMKLPPRKPVTPETIDLYRQRALRKSRGRYDEESGAVISPENMTLVQKWLFKIKELFTKDFWTEKFVTDKNSEILVDGALLSWAYLEIGTIETIGSLVAYFVVLWKRGIGPADARAMQKANLYFMDSSPSWNGRLGPIDGPTQLDILREAQSMYYMSIFICQAFNLFACKSRFSVPFGKYMFANRITFYSVLGGATLACFIIYVPGVEYVFNTSRSLIPLYWLIPVGFGCLIIAYASLRLIIRRKLAPIRWNKDIPGLQMYPTIRTTRSVSVGRSI